MDERVLQQEERASLSLRRLYAAYGYTHYKMSKFEEYDLYVQNKSFLVSDQVITFTDTNGRLMALKPDVTLSIVKNTDAPTESVQKLYYDENVYRVSGRDNAYREIKQVGLECQGRIDAACIAEVLALAEQSLCALGGDYVLCVSHLGILCAVLDALSLSTRARARVLACIAEKNLHGMEAILEEEQVGVEERAPLRALLTTYGAPAEVVARLRDALPVSACEMLNELDCLLGALSGAKLRLDFSIVQDMSYYNGIVFCGYVEKIPSRVLSGGQYDRLVQRMGKKTGAIGFAVYLDLLTGRDEELSDYDVDAVLCYGSESAPDAVLAAAAELRAQGMCVTVQPSRPAALRYRRLYQLEKGVCRLVEDRA